jgi:hypothetical protein
MHDVAVAYAKPCTLTTHSKGQRIRGYSRRRSWCRCLDLRWLPSRTVVWLFAAAVPLLVTPLGCKQDEPTFEVVPLTGTIEKIERTGEDTGTISVLYYSEKHQQELIGTGVVTADTEIMINGAVAKLADLREGDHVRGEVRIDKKGGRKTQSALKIYVDRPTPVDHGD